MDIQTDTKKTEKLVSALYLLTSFFDEKEPMKWRLRELGAKLFGIKESRNIVLEIVNLLSVAKNASLISDTNFDIVNREFSLLLPQTGSLSEVFKKIEEKKPEKPQFYLASSVPATPAAIKDKTPKPPREEGVVAVKKNTRQGIILGLLKKKKEIMVKDVSPLISGVSEKTIQRELLSMVSSGILKKEGEKRWSRYSLAGE